MATPLAELLLALALAHAPPGRSPYSLEVMPECGSDRAKPECPIERLCAEPTLECRPPRWSPSRKAWVRVEPKKAAMERYETITRVLADTAERLAACKEDSECDPIDWPGDTRSLAIATLAVAVHESGLRRDIQHGEGPLGRGPAREACLVQLAPEQAPKLASWIAQGERATIAAKRENREAFAESLLGDSEEALSRCFEIGMRMLARSRAACKKSGRSWAFGMYSMYGSGHTCHLPGPADVRARTFEQMMAESRMYAAKKRQKRQKRAPVDKRPKTRAAPVNRPDS